MILLILWFPNTSGYLTIQFSWIHDSNDPKLDQILQGPPSMTTFTTWQSKVGCPAHLHFCRNSNPHSALIILLHNSQDSGHNLTYYQFIIKDITQDSQMGRGAIHDVGAGKVKNPRTLLAAPFSQDSQMGERHSTRCDWESEASSGPSQSTCSPR